MEHVEKARRRAMRVAMAVRGLGEARRTRRSLGDSIRLAVLAYTARRVYLEVVEWGCARGRRVLRLRM